MNKWYLESGPESDVAVSTRVRFARNLSAFPFPVKMTPEQQKEVVNLVSSALLTSDSPLREGFRFLDMERLSPAEAFSLAEHHIISPEFAKNRQGRGLLLSEDESVSIMINEEDHIRLQVMRPGLALEDAFRLADELDSLLDSRLSFCFDEKLGFLTQCPSNLGTGMRASLMLHLPALEVKDAIGPLGGTLSKIGLSIRGTYGEGSEALGSFYQVSNQITLGLSEQAVTANLASVARQLFAQERSLRRELAGGERLADKAWRSLGILRTARILSSGEFMNLISWVRLGVSMGILTETNLSAVNRLISECQSNTLLLRAGRKLDAPGRDRFRAELVRSALAPAESRR